MLSLSHQSRSAHVKDALVVKIHLEPSTMTGLVAEV